MIRVLLKLIIIKFITFRYMESNPFGICPCCKKMIHPFTNPKVELMQCEHIMCEHCRAV